jgi:hypothetical protein
MSLGQRGNSGCLCCQLHTDLLYPNLRHDYGFFPLLPVAGATIVPAVSRLLRQGCSRRLGVHARRCIS